MNPAVRIKDLLEWFLYGPARKRGLCCGRSRGPAELGKARDVCLMMIDRDLEGRGGRTSTVGGPTRGVPKMIGSRSPAQLSFSLSWLD